MTERFKVHLGGIIELLSNHLYGSPDVFLRELLQNGVDALAARRSVEAGHVGVIEIEWMDRADGPPLVQFRDDGVGLDEAEIHRFLATIGESSKRDGVFAATDFIGRFGIGLLSCFIVSNTVRVVTRSVKPDASTLQWSGRRDGTYEVRTSADAAVRTGAALERPGTIVTLELDGESADRFDAATVRERLVHYGGLLPWSITFIHGETRTAISRRTPPWRGEGEGRSREAALAYGRDVLGQTFIDAIPLRVPEVGLEGLAFVLPESPHYLAKQQHRVYLRNMLLSERAENLLPEWAFFVRCIVNASGLEPNASREGFYENAALAKARDGLGKALRAYLIDLARATPAALQRLMHLHGLSMKALALDDEEFMRIVGDWFTFETSAGVMTLGELREASPTIRYAPTVDEFRQMARVAQAQEILLVNAGYTYDVELLEQAAEVMPGVSSQRFLPGDLSRHFEALDPSETAAYEALLRVGQSALSRFDCDVEVKRFEPKDIPALFIASREELFQRDAERSMEESDDLFGELMKGALAQKGVATRPRVSFNAKNTFIQKLAVVDDDALLRRSLEMLYVQSLLLGHRPLRQKEMGLLNRGLMALIEAQLETRANRSIH